MYGRGSSDDGYSFFTSIHAISACQAQSFTHPRCVITIEGSEEGEMYEHVWYNNFRDDLIYYLDKYYHLLGNPNLVICLDSDAFSTETLVISSSLRGCLSNITKFIYYFRL